MTRHDYQDMSAGYSPLRVQPWLCECVHSCADDPATACSLSGQWHVHPGDLCPVHPDAPGDH